MGIVRCNITNRQMPIAVKMIKFENTNEAIKRRDDELRRIAITKQIDAMRIELNILAYIQRLNERPHPNLIRLIGATTTNENEFYLMIEYCENGSLDCYLREKYKNKQFINEIVYNGSDDSAAKVIWKVTIV